METYHAVLPHFMTEKLFKPATEIYWEFFEKHYKHMIFLPCYKMLLGKRNNFETLKKVLSILYIIYSTEIIGVVAISIPGDTPSVRTMLH